MISKDKVSGRVKLSHPPLLRFYGQFFDKMKKSKIKKKDFQIFKESIVSLLLSYFTLDFLFSLFLFDVCCEIRERKKNSKKKKNLFSPFFCVISPRGHEKEKKKKKMAKIQKKRKKMAKKGLVILLLIVQFFF